MSERERQGSAWPEPDIDDWRRLVEKALAGKDPSTLRSPRRDGSVVEPLYQGAQASAPISARAARPWTIVHAIDAADPDEANAEALTALEGGATGLAVRFAEASSGIGVPFDAEALRTALQGVDLAAIHLTLAPHADGASAVAWLRALVDKAGVAPELADIAFGLDPLAAFIAGRGDPAQPLATCFRELSARPYRGTFATLDGRVVHEAGGTEPQEIAAILAAGVWWLRTLDDAGIAAAVCLPRLGASLAVDCEQFPGIAKLRALRLVWTRLEELIGVDRQPLRIHAETSRRMLTRADPTTNLLRTTLAAFAAAAGGADSISVLPHTAALGHPDRNAQALARNVQLLLMEEAHLYRVADPGAGAGAVAALTDALAERAWAEFQTIEREGGLMASLAAGGLQARIAEARAALASNVADGRLPLVGATIYRAPDESADTAPLQESNARAASGLAPIRLEQFARAAA